MQITGGEILTMLTSMSICLCLEMSVFTLRDKITSEESAVDTIKIVDTIEYGDLYNHIEDNIEILTRDKNYILSESDIELIALLTMAEAEGESEYGKRLVIDTVLNRIDSDYFPDTVSDVVYQPEHFSSVWNGRIDKCYVSNDILELVKEELNERSNSDVIFFTAGNYSNYGVPMFNEENHYFSSYE